MIGIFILSTLLGARTAALGCWLTSKASSGVSRVLALYVFVAGVVLPTECSETQPRFTDRVFVPTCYWTSEMLAWKASWGMSRGAIMRNAMFVCCWPDLWA